jgi:hypothetical protein
MKNLIFLLLMAAFLAGFGFAEPAHPPDAARHEMTADIFMAEYDVYGDIVTQPTVLVMVMPAAAEPSSFQAIMVTSNNIAVQPQFSGTILICFLDTGQYHTGSVSGHHYLRC